MGQLETVSLRDATSPIVFKLEPDLLSQLYAERTPHALWLLVSDTTPATRLHLKNNGVILSTLQLRSGFPDHFGYFRIDGLPTSPPTPGSLTLEFENNGATPYAFSVAAALTAPTSYQKKDIFDGLRVTLDAKSWWLSISLSIVALVLIFCAFVSPSLKNQRLTSFLALAGAVAVIIVAGWQRIGVTSFHVPNFGMGGIDRDMEGYNPTSSTPFLENAVMRVANKISVPEVAKPFVGAHASGELHFEVYSGNWHQDLFAPHESALWGWYARIQALSPDWVTYLIGATIISLFVFVPLSFLIGVEWAQWLPLTIGGVSSVILSIIFAMGWDELFINLRHSFMVANHGSYSYNARELVEGTVDFLPFFLGGLLGRLGLPVLDALLLVCLSGNLIVMAASYLIVRQTTGNTIYGAIIGTLMGLFPCVLFTGGTGFTAAFFSGCALLSVYFLLFAPENRFRLGLLLTGLLTLVRTEGIILAFLCGCYVCVVRPLWLVAQGELKDTLPQLLKKTAINGLFLAGPFVLSAIVRYATFGIPLPAPMVFKFTKGNSGYLKAGLEQFASTLSIFHMDALLILFGLSLVFVPWSRLRRFPIVQTAIVFFGFTLVYYSGGGDWFPLEWNRYMMPFTLFMYVATAVAMWWASERLMSQAGPILVFGLCCVFALEVQVSDRNRSIFGGEYFRGMPTADRWSRIKSLASLGHFFKQTTDPNARIASPEMSTVMYHAERDLVDLLGITNLDIAKSPLNPLSYPADLAHRRRNPATIAKNMPEYIALWEMSVRGSYDIGKESLEQLRSRLIGGSFSTFQQDVAFYRAGSFDYLTSLGYVPIAVFFRNVYYYYLVQQKSLREHLAALDRYGLSHVGSFSVPWGVENWVTERFAPQ